MADWRECNNRSTPATLNGPGTPVERFRAAMDVWLDEVDFNPVDDIAICDIDDERIEAFGRVSISSRWHR